MEIKCINDKSLEDISAGFVYLKSSVICNVKLSKEEFDELKEAKIIGEDGNLYYRNARKAFEYLEEKGYKRNIKMIPMGMNAESIFESESKRWMENRPINLEIV